ncbi:hypothetical protein HMPREF0813_00467 [Streptococcus anginosus F0211]|uniref:Uncharacterized protein n=1 Tax=Streptococcus anginosus F0211 TaxID=706437 RepID=E6IZQ2_STRAP|nr:hypothetical protein HMPREF0813_00467 [Streptococcus anginosus F0211]
MDFLLCSCLFFIKENFFKLLNDKYSRCKLLCFAMFVGNPKTRTALLDK